MKSKRLHICKSDVRKVLGSHYMQGKTSRDQQKFLERITFYIDEMGSEKSEARSHSRDGLSRTISEYSNIRESFVLSKTLGLLDVGNTEEILKRVQEIRNIFLSVLSEIQQHKLPTPQESKKNSSDSFGNGTFQKVQPKRSTTYLGFVDSKLYNLSLQDDFGLDELMKFLKNNVVKKGDGSFVRNLMNALGRAVKNDLERVVNDESLSISGVREKARGLYQKIRTYVLGHLPQMTPRTISFLYKSYLGPQIHDREILKLLKERLFSDHLFKRISHAEVSDLLKNIASLGMNLTPKESGLLVDIFEFAEQQAVEMNITKYYYDLSKIAIGLMMLKHPLAKPYLKKAQEEFNNDSTLQKISVKEKKSWLERRTFQALTEILDDEYSIETSVRVLLFEVDFRVTHIKSGKMYLVEADGTIYHDKIRDGLRDEAILTYSNENYEGIIRIDPFEAIGQNSVNGRNYEIFKAFVQKKLSNAGFSISEESEMRKRA